MYYDHCTAAMRLALNHARAAADERGHPYLAPEHMALGLLASEACLAHRILEELDVSLSEVRAQIDRSVVPGNEPLAGLLPFTQPAKRVLEAAMREARDLEHEFIGSGHLLLGLVVTADTIPFAVFAARLVDPLAIRLLLEMTGADEDRPAESVDAREWRVETLRRAAGILRRAQRENLANEVDRAADQLP